MYLQFTMPEEQAVSRMLRAKKSSRHPEQSLPLSYRTCAGPSALGYVAPSLGLKSCHSLRCSMVQSTSFAFEFRKPATALNVKAVFVRGFEV